MTTSDRIRVVLVDDHEMVRSGLATFLLAYDDLELVGEAATGEQALDVCARLCPDVVIMDLKMPRLDGVAATAALSQRVPGVRVLALTSFDDGDLVQRALDAGAVGYLLKDIDADALANAIRAAHRGQPTLAPEIAWSLFHASRQPTRPGSDLTPREREVLALMVRGLTNPEIANELVVGASTVKSHVSSILSKLGARTRSQAVSLALQAKIVEGNDD